jgi:hypothetical protein
MQKHGKETKASCHLGSLVRLPVLSPQGLSVARLRVPGFGVGGYIARCFPSLAIEKHQLLSLDVKRPAW